MNRVKLLRCTSNIFNRYYFIVEFKDNLSIYDDYIYMITDYIYNAELIDGIQDKDVLMHGYKNIELEQISNKKFHVIYQNYDD